MLGLLVSFSIIGCAVDASDVDDPGERGDDLFARREVVIDALSGAQVEVREGTVMSVRSDAAFTEAQDWAGGIYRAIEITTDNLWFRFGDSGTLRAFVDVNGDRDDGRYAIALRYGNLSREQGRWVVDPNSRWFWEDVTITKTSGGYRVSGRVAETRDKLKGLSYETKTDVLSMDVSEGDALTETGTFHFLVIPTWDFGWWENRCCSVYASSVGFAR